MGDNNGLQASISKHFHGIVVLCLNCSNEQNHEKAEKDIAISYTSVSTWVVIKRNINQGCK